MANYYIQANTLNDALAAISANTKAGHFITSSAPAYSRSYINYSSSTGHNFCWAKQLVYNAQGVAIDVVYSAYFDDVPADKLNFKQFADMLVGKEFLGSSDAIANYLTSNSSVVVDYYKKYNDEYPYCVRAGFMSLYGFTGDSEYPWCKICSESPAVYYKKFFDEATQSKRIGFMFFNYSFIVSGEQGFYSVKYDYIGVTYAIGGAYYRVIQGADGAPGPAGADGIDGIDGVNGLDAPMPDLTGIETALEKLTNLDKLQKYDDMLTAFGNLEKISKILLRFLSVDAPTVEALKFSGENKNADNLVTKNITLDSAAINQKLGEIVKTLCRFMSFSANTPDDLVFITLGEITKNAENLRDLMSVLDNTDSNNAYPVLSGALADLMPIVSKLVSKAVQKVNELE